jgi:uncharacterized membrane protein YdjX (TVP38/TMEM64 family)
MYAGFLLGPIEGLIIALIGDIVGAGLLGNAFAYRHISY